jgi:hypothetical protein
MREIRLSGSVRGAGREVRPYRDPLIPMRSSVPFGMLARTRISGLPQTARPPTTAAKNTLCQSVDTQL